MRKGWEYKKFEDCLEKAPKAKQVQTSEYNAGTKYPIVSQEDKLVSGYCDDVSLLCHFDKPIVIFGDHTRVLKYVDFDFVVGADGVKILIPKDFLLAKTLLYYLQWYNIPSLGYSRHYKLLKELSIPIPSLIEQQSIVAELDKINELISLKKSQLNDLDALAQSIFYDMFGDPVVNEKGWEMKPWKQLLETKLGKMLDKAKQDVNAKSFPYLANLNVQWGYFDLSDIRTMPFSEQEIEKFRLKDGDLMICEGGESGRCAIWKATDNDMFFQKAVHRARVIDKSTTNIVYIRYLLEYTKKGDGLKDYITKSTIEHLTGEKLNKLPIPLPPLHLQQSFAAKIEAIERQKQQVKQSLKDLETLLASRMQYWFEEE